MKQSKIRAGAKAVWNVEFSRELDATIGAFQPDLAHFHTPFPLMSPAAFRVAARRRVPTVATVHSYRYSCIQGQFYRNGRACELCLGRKLKLSGIRHRCYHDSLLGSSLISTSLALHRSIGTFGNDVNAWIVFTDFMKRKLCQEGIQEEKVIVKPNSVSDPGTLPEGTRDSALFLGRLEPEKGIVAMLKAWEVMSDPPRLSIFGDGRLRDLVEAAARKSDRIQYGGWVDQGGVEEALAKAKFLILPSQWYEGQPIVAIQSFAAGVPVIASDIGNFSDLIVPEDNGYLFQSGSAESLASVVTRAWSQEDSYLALRRGARAHYERGHSKTGNTEILLSAYSQAIELSGSDQKLRTGTSA
jgi:glycosyltransferase involved in cell wall biosynthesis